jgi:hypothetical protein
MDQATRVCVVQRFADRLGNCYRVDQVELVLAPQSVAEGAPLHVRENDVRLPLVLARVEHGQNVRVMQPGSAPDLLQEPIGRGGLDQLGTKDLDRDGDTALCVAGKMDRCRRTLTKEALDGITSSKEA